MTLYDDLRYAQEVTQSIATISRRPTVSPDELTSRVSRLRDVYVAAYILNEPALALHMSALVKAEKWLGSNEVPEVDNDGYMLIRGSPGQERVEDGAVVRDVPYHRATLRTCSCAEYYNTPAQITCMHRQVVWILQMA